MTRRQLLSAVAAAPLAAAQKPNVVLIVADDLGFVDLGCCGDNSIHTPNIDSLARDGVRFTDFVVSWPACTPSRSSILTGRYPQRNGLYDMIRNDEVNWKHQFTEEDYAVSPEMTLGLDLREVTLGQLLKSAGYATAAVGKWDSGRARRFLPTQRGFDFFYGFANTGIDYYTHERYGIPSMFRNMERIKESGHATDLFTREAVHFIDANRARPFFLYLPYNAPHGASTFDKQAPQVPEEFLARYKGDRRAQYKALITHMDAGIGRILSQLKQHSLDANTLVIFTSDNGGGGKSNGPLRGGKATLWEGGLRVPLLARWPGIIPAGSTCSQFASTMELFPTLAAVSGAKLPPVHLDGFNMLPLLQGKPGKHRTGMFFQRRAGKAARIGEYKWIDSPGANGLYHLPTDPGEQRDLSGSKPELFHQARSRWQAWRAEMDAAEPRGPFRDY